MKGWIVICSSLLSRCINYFDDALHSFRASHVRDFDKPKSFVGSWQSTLRGATKEMFEDLSSGNRRMLFRTRWVFLRLTLFGPNRFNRRWWRKWWCSYNSSSKTLFVAYATLHLCGLHVKSKILAKSLSFLNFPRHATHNLDGNECLQHFEIPKVRWFDKQGICQGLKTVGTCH